MGLHRERGVHALRTSLSRPEEAMATEMKRAAAGR
jgi:hypothetical protein